jgi:hypothetical protein
MRAFARRTFLGMGAAAAALALPAIGAPAPWYYWRSKLDGRRVCAQTSPGQGWELDSEAYSKPMCRGAPAAQPRR